MNDSDLTGDALLRRIDELTGNDKRDPSGGNGWRHLLYAAAKEIRDLRYEVNDLEGERGALEYELRKARDD